MTTILFQFFQTIKTWCRKHPFISRLLLVILVWKGFWWFYGFAMLNPNPKEAIVVKGRFPFDRSFNLYFQNYGTAGDAKWHYHLCLGYLLSSKASRCDANVEWASFEVKKPSPDQYEITLYKDYYLPGLQQWSNTGYRIRPYQNKNSIDRNKLIFGSNLVPYTRYGAPYICDDSESGLIKSQGALWCMLQYDDPDRKVGHLRYKHLKLPATPSSGDPKESIVDFWLYSELEEMLKQPSNALPSTQISTPRSKQ